MDDQKQQIIDKLQSSKNILVTVSANPSVDQLAACIALTVLLNKLDKHATAVYSGVTPSTIEFLQPGETIEKNTDSLRDFIISLDKAKADKLRYKVEEKVVKIFITPYRTSLTDKDLEFSQGDFNVDVVIALGVRQQQDIDSAITSHGRILHDATVITVNNTQDGDLGTIHWRDLSASSLSEMVSTLATSLKQDALDAQISTALLTGIVAETQRFRNAKTSPRTMSISAELMAAGANQQLVASELEKKPAEDAPAEAKGETEVSHDTATPAEPSQNAPQSPAPEQPSNDATFEIHHEGEGESPEPAAPAPERPNSDQTTPPTPDTAIPADEPVPAPQAEAPSSINDVKQEAPKENSIANAQNVPKLVTEPPRMGGTLTANSRPETLDPSTDPMSMPTPPAVLSRSNDPTTSTSPFPSFRPAPVPPTMPDPFAAASQSSGVPVAPSPSLSSQNPLQPFNLSEPTLTPTQPTDPMARDHETLDQLEQEVKATEAIQSAGEDLDSARQAVEDAIKAATVDNAIRPTAEQTQPMAPVASLNAQGEMSVEHDQAATALPPVEPPMPVAPAGQNTNEPAPLANSPADQPFTMPLPPSLNLPPLNPNPPTTPQNGAATPPPVPPPMMPPGFPPAQ